MSMLFADVRGSTALSEKMSPTEFSRLINRFYTQSTKVIIEEDGLAGIDGSKLESHSLELKGISAPVLVRVMHGS